MPKKRPPTPIVEAEDTDSSDEGLAPQRQRSVSSDNLVQTAIKGEVGEYVTPDHRPGECFPGRQLPTSQLSLFETGFKRKTGQMSLFEAGFKRRRTTRVTASLASLCC